MNSSILTSLGVGSGIDSAAMVRDLAAAVRAPKEQQLASRERLNSARISALAGAKSSFATFSDAVEQSLMSLSEGQSGLTLSAVLKDMVTAFNDMRGALLQHSSGTGQNGTAGVLAGDAGMRVHLRDLSALSRAPMGDGSSGLTLADVGITVSRDGSWQFDTAKLTAAQNENPAAVAALFDPASPGGLAKGLRDITARMNAPHSRLSSALRDYQQRSKDFAQAREKLDAADSLYRARLEKSFAGMEKQMAALGAVQSYVKQQIAIWTTQD